MSVPHKLIKGVDKLELTSFGRGVAVFEAQGADIYSDGFTDAAYAFEGVEYLEVPTIMEDVKLRLALEPPARIPRESTVFEFYADEIVSDGGMVTVSEHGVVGGRYVPRSIGYVVADSCAAFEGPLPSGNRRRPSDV